MNAIRPTNIVTLPRHKITLPAHLPDKLVSRSQLLEDLRHLQAKKKKIIVIEARAGSGKTVFAQQYLQQIEEPKGWCQLGLEDNDPIALLHALLSLFHQQLPGFYSKEVAVALEQGTIHYSEIKRFAELLAQEISSVNSCGFHLVLDDLHLLEGAVDSVSLLTTLMAKTPDWMQWILLSRHSVKNVLQISQVERPALMISHDELDFSLEETASLLNNVFHLAVPLEKVKNLHRQTEGWVTGLVLCALQSKRKIKDRQDVDVSFDLTKKQQYLTDYFLQDALADFSATEIPEILQMVLLEDLPFALLDRIFWTTSC